MNVFIIPSWYPSKHSPNSGVFIQKQVRSIAALNPKDNFIMSLWGHRDTEISLSNPIDWLKKFIWISKNKPHIHQDKNIFSIINPTIHSHRSIYKGGIDQIIKSNFQNFLKAKRELGQIDLIHAHNSYPGGIIAKHISDLEKTPFIINEHMSPFPFETLLKRKKVIIQIKKAILAANEVIAVGMDQLNEIEALSGRKPIRLPNTVNELDFFPLFKKKEKNKFKCLIIGGLIPQKGIDILLKAISIDINKFSELNVTFTIIGNGPLKRELLELSNNLKINHLIEWIDYIPNDRLQIVYNMSDMLILSSNHESFGIVCIEAMACGKPVIATACGGPEEILTPESGILVPKNNPSKLYEAIIYAIENYNEFDPRKIREHFVSKYSSHKYSKDLFKIYKEVTKNGKTQSCVE